MLFKFAQNLGQVGFPCSLQFVIVVEFSVFAGSVRVPSARRHKFRGFFGIVLGSDGAEHFGSDGFHWFSPFRCSVRFRF